MTKNKPQVQAPVKKPEGGKPTVVDTNKAFMPKSVAGMSPDAKVTYFATLHARYGNPANVPSDLKDNVTFISAMNAIADAVAVSIAIEEAANKDTALHLIVGKTDKPAYGAIKFLCQEYGYEIPDANLLPAPTKDQLASAGMSDAAGEDKGVIDIDPKKIAAKTKAKIAAEKKNTSKAVDKPEDVKDDAQLSASLLNIFVKGDSPVLRASNAISFYRSYLKIQAKDDKAKIEEIDKMSDVVLLNDVKNIIGTCPYKESGVSGFLRKSVATTGSPVTAFNLLYRSARDRKTGEMAATNELLAAICRVYVTWSCEATIGSCNDVIESEERQLKKLDEKNEKHAEAIATMKKNIESKKNDIEWANNIISIVTNPDSSLVENIIEAYNDEKNENHNNAVVIINDTLATYYPNQDMSKYEAECVEHNAKQYVGIVTNLFRDPSQQLINYGHENIVELIPVTEEKPAEEEPKK